MTKNRPHWLALLGCALATASQLEGAPLGDPLPATDLALTLTDGPDPVAVSQATLKYFTAITNAGPASATNVRLTIPVVLSAVELAPLPTPCALEADAIVCRYDTLGPGISVTFDIAMTVRSSAPAVLAPDPATLVADNPDPVPGNNSVSLTTTVYPIIAGLCDPIPAEGDSGFTTVTCYGSLAGPHVQTVIANVSLVGGTALPGLDFLVAPSTVTFPPGVRIVYFPAAVVGDMRVEGYDSFRVQLSDASNAFVSTTPYWNYIPNDDTEGAGDLSHGYARTGLVPSDPLDRTAHVFWANAERPASYEVVLDGVSGDAVPLLPMVTATEYGQNPTSGAPVGTGTAVSLRFRVDQLTPASPVPVWVEGAGCNADCGPDDTYRLRFYETTLTGGRFNNVGAQRTVLVLQNAGAGAAVGTVFFWSADGTMLATRDWSLPPKGSLALDTGALPGAAGASGSLTVTHDASYGTLLGKATSVDSSTGFALDTPLTTRPR